MDEPVRQVQRALVEFDAGERKNIAIIGEPLSGKTAVIDAVISRYGKPVGKVSLSSILPDEKSLPDLDGPEKIIAVDDCQYMFLRRIGGFKVLERFLDTMASSDRLYITSWNKYAWNYLKQVFNLADYFSSTVTLPRLETGDIESIINARYTTRDIRYLYDEKRDSPMVKFKWRPVRIGGFSISVPYVVPGSDIIRRVRGEDVSDARFLIFEKIARLSMGNPGVALAIWRRAYHEEEIRISKVNLPEYETGMSPDEAFVLGNILMMKSITEEDLVKITAGALKMDRILYVLQDRGLIKNVSGRYIIEPLAMFSIVKSLKKSRQVW